MALERPVQDGGHLREIVNGQPVCVGFEIGERGAWVSAMSAPSLTERPQRRWRTRFDAPPNVDRLLDRLAEGAAVVSGATPEGVGVAVWGIGATKIDEQARWWTDPEFCDRVRTRLGAPVRWRAAVDAAALAEARFGAGLGASPFIYVHLGREVLASLVWEGRPASAAHNLGGQLGHWRVMENGPRCACGVTGHLNPLCSSQGFVRLAIGVSSQDDAALAAVSAITAGRAESLTAANIVALASQGVAPLRELAELAAGALGQALGRLALVVDPSVIALGGPLGVAGGLFLDWTRDRMMAETRSTRADGQHPRIMPASLEPASAAIGAWLLGQEAVAG